MSNAIKNRRLIDKSGNDHKAFWRTIKKVLPGERKAASPNISIDGTLTSDKNRIADSLNQYFTSSVTRLLESVRTSCGSSASPTPSRHYPDLNFAEVVEFQGVKSTAEPLSVRVQQRSI